MRRSTLLSAVRSAAAGAVGALLLAGALADGVAAQDIEAIARARGIQLPDAYYELKRSDPTAFEFSGAAVGRASTISEGTVTLPVVLALFSDSPEPGITRDMIDQSLFTGPAARGTVSGAYDEISRGALEVRGDVFEWVRTGFTMAQVVGPNSGLGNPADHSVGEYFLEALQTLDATVDFSQYDNDGPDGVPNSGDDDGYVDVITFEYLEVSGSCGGPSIWPHRWSMRGQNGEPFVSDDASAQDSVGSVRVNDYITQSVADCDGVTVQDASTIAHEFGHALGLPDYYHPVATDGGIGPEIRRWVMGCWALMAGGSWGCGRIGEQRDPFGPTHMMAHSKYQLGWLDYVDVGEVWNEEVVLDPVQTSGRALRLPLGGTVTEFLIAEYRAQIGFDAQLPADGVLFYKQDTDALRRPDPATNAPYFLTILEQDGDGALVRNHLRGGDRGVPGDAWGVDGPSGPLNAESVPALRLSSGARTSIMVHEVTVEGGQARMIISTGRTPRLIQPADPFEVEKVRSFVRSVRIAGGTGPYTTMGTLPPGVVLSAAGDELLIAGSFIDEGPHEMTLSVRDATGKDSNEVVVSVSAPFDWVVDTAALYQRFLRSDLAPLTPGELDYLDVVGNQNGRYDVGDLRKWLREQGAPGN